MRNFLKIEPKNYVFLTLLSVLLAGVICTGGFAQNSLDDKMQTVRKVAEDWLQAGIEQYHRGFYRQSERSLLMAKDYEDYLSEEDRKELEVRLDQTHSAVVKLNKLLGRISKADQLYKKGELEQAKTIIEELSGNEYLNKPRQEKVNQLLDKIKDELSKKQEIFEKKEKAETKYNNAVAYYLKGEYEKAQSLFESINAEYLEEIPESETPGSYLDKIEKKLSAEKKAEKQIQKRDAVQQAEERIFETTPEPKPEEQVDKTQKPQSKQKLSYIEKVKRKRNIIRGHTQAVIEDTFNEAQSLLAKNKFEQAKQKVDSARLIVNQNKVALGQDLYEGYRKDLVMLENKVEDSRKQAAKQAQQQRKEALESQRQKRQQMKQARQDRISQLMKSAGEYQKQQLYKQALGQINALLAIDPQNQQALIQKDMLEDMISFQKQLEVRSEADEERVKLLTQNEAASIPYAKELTYAKNWKEIDAKRQQERNGFQDPANEEVYNQLSKTVDLSMFRPEMPFSDALNAISQSVSPSLIIVPLWVDLEQNAEVYRSTPINMDAISSVPLKTGLRLLLESVSTGFAELGYTVEDGVIRIATKDSLNVELETRTYDVTILLGQPADYFAGVGDSGGRSGGGRSGGTGSGGGESYEEYFEDETESMSPDERREMTQTRKETLINTVKETISPESWFDAGGEGTITYYEDKKLIVRQTREVHNQIKDLIDEMQRTLGEQVGIEARFLVVGENFLEDIGLDMDFSIGDDGGKWDKLVFNQDTDTITSPDDSGISGSLFDAVAMSTSGSYGTLGDLEVNFVLRATQAHKDAKTLSTGNVTVLSGESAVFRTRETIRFIEPPDVGSTDISYGGGGGTSQSDIETEISEVPVGTTLNVTPTITPDKKHVLLNIYVEKTTFKGFNTQTVEIPNLGGDSAISYTVGKIPQTEISRVRTRVSVPDGATLLLGGQKVTAETDIEAGVPGLSKMPIIGRLFNSRSKIRDQKVLLILVKPIIILQEERDEEALATADYDY
jgi:general secretion pathway protein D